MSNADTNTTLSLVQNPSNHIKRHRKRRKIEKEAFSGFAPPPCSHDSEIVDSILATGDGREDQDQQGKRMGRGGLDHEKVLVINQGVDNSSGSIAGGHRRRTLAFEGGSEQNRLRHLGAAAPNNEKKRQGKMLKQQSLASPSSFHDHEKDHDIAGGGEATVQRPRNPCDEATSGASSDAATATVHVMRSMISVPPQNGVLVQPPSSFASHLLFGGVDPSSSLAFRLAEIQAAHNRYEVIQSLHVNSRMSNWAFAPPSTSALLSLGYPPMDSSGGLQTASLTANDMSMLPWLGASAARGISSRALLPTSLQSNPSISSVLQGLEDFDSARKASAPPDVRSDVVASATTATFGLGGLPSGDVLFGGRREGLTPWRDRPVLQGLPVTRLENAIGNAEAASGVEGVPMFPHRTLPPLSHDAHVAAPSTPCLPCVDSADGNMSVTAVHPVCGTSNQSDRGLLVAEGHPREHGTRDHRASPSKRLDDRSSTNSEDTVVRAARLGTAADKRSKESHHDDDHQTSMVLFVEGDEHYLTEYQCLLRKQLEVFEAGPHDIRGSTQGRNVPILLGQVGLRCRHCANLPLAARTKGAVYYSQTVEGMYQIAQNMSKVHLCQRCYRIPPDIQQELISLKNESRRATGGKEYWTAALTTMGVYEDGPILRMKQVPT